MNDELYHHGRAGQRWGIQNGPPYPLSREKTKKYKEKQKHRVRTTLKDIPTEELQKKVERLEAETNYKKKFAERHANPSKAFVVLEKSANTAGTILKNINGDKSDSVKITKAISSASKAAGNITKNQKINAISNMDLSKYDINSLKQMSNRLDLERKYIQLKAEDVNRGKKAVSNAIEGLTILTAVGTVGGVIVKNIKEDEKSA